MNDRRWKLDPGLQGILIPAANAKLADLTGEIADQIAEGVITEQTRRILVEWRWITPRDGRLTLQNAPSPSRTAQDARKGE